MRSRKIWFAVFLLCAGIALGCSSAPSNVVVAVTPVAITVALNNEQSFTATVTGSSNTSVTWDVTGPTGAAVAGGNTNIGTIDTSGNYIAPNVYPSGCTPTPTAPCTVTITAVSAADTSVTGTATVTLSSGITLSVSPATATIGTSETYPFTSTITGTSNTAVTWTVCYVIKSAEDCNPADANGQTSNGTINSTTGLYTAPQIAPTAAVQIDRDVREPEYRAARADVRGCLRHGNEFSDDNFRARERHTLTRVQQRRTKRVAAQPDLLQFGLVRDDNRRNDYASGAHTRLHAHRCARAASHDSHADDHSRAAKRHPAVMSDAVAVSDRGDANAARHRGTISR